MLSRVATPSTLLTTRAFSTSLAFRVDPKKPEAPPVRMNPLVGNVTRLSTPEPKAPEAPKPQTTPAQTTTTPSDLPPPPPPTTAAAAEDQSKPAQKHPYSAASDTFDIVSNLIANKAMAYGESIATNPIDRPQIRAKAVTGRTVFVKDRISQTSGPTPMVALKVLNRMIREDHVKNKYHSQKFHERKGLKKKRLRSQRWRARFKHGFKATVSRVLELKKQGW
ncbi:hypothetical protein CEP53_000747 [Fusarium sp. AF-6]|nr:hypothetical protein CEP53_000747 [Fusarium sp. AF-6]